MKKRKWLAPLLWFILPTLLLCAAQAALAVAPLFAAANYTPTFVGAMEYLRLLMEDGLFFRFFINSLFTVLATPLFLSLLGGVGWLILRKTNLSIPARYAVVCGGTVLLAAVLCYFMAFSDLPQYLQLEAGAAWRLLWPSVARYSLISLQSGVFACLFHYICEAVARRRAVKKSGFTETE